MSTRPSSLVVGLASALASLASLAPLASKDAHALPLSGTGARDIALAQSDLADADPASSAATNPAHAHKPGTRVLLSYGYTVSDLKISGHDAGAPNIAGFDLGAQVGFDLGDGFQIGGAFIAYLPDAALARISFRRGTAPYYPIYEAAPQRTRAGFAMGFGYENLSLGAGVAVVTDVGGDGVTMRLTEDERGTVADGEIRVSLPLAPSPFGALTYRFNGSSVSLKVQAPTAINLDVNTTAEVDIEASPLNGRTEIFISGTSGYEPLTATLAANWGVTRAIRFFGALEYARWSAAPSPEAVIDLEIDLEITPETRVVHFVLPRFRDTISPRLGIEIGLLGQPQVVRAPDGPAGPDGPNTPDVDEPADNSRVKLRAGWAYVPSPVPNQTGFTSYADANRHTVSVGGGADFGKMLGVGIKGDFALSMSILSERTFTKPSAVLPHSFYTASGNFFTGALSLTAAWE
jgi:long-subunit fatty acid transport protein